MELAEKGDFSRIRIGTGLIQKDKKGRRIGAHKNIQSRRKIRLTDQDNQLINMKIITLKTMKNMNREICKGDFCNYIMF